MYSTNLFVIPLILFTYLHWTAEGNKCQNSTITENGECLSSQQTYERLEHFSEQLRKTFVEYSRINAISNELDLNWEPITQKAHEKIDFLDASQVVVNKLNDFFEKKIDALRRIVQPAESTQKLHLNDVYDTEKCAKLLHESETVSDQYFRVVENNSTVHVALNEYKCEEKILKDQEWTNNAELANIWQQNANADSTIERQYIGTYSGLTRIYPQLNWEIKPKAYTMDLFDPRYRPWFVGSETAPRDMLFLIDFGSVRGLTLHMMKTLILYILSTLTPNDFFTGIWYNSRRDLVVAECLPRKHGGAGAKFLPATTRNKQLFLRYLDRIEEKDQATLPPALNFSLAQFLQNSKADSSGSGWERERRTSGGHKMIVLFTDGVELWPIKVVQEFQQKYPDDKIRIFGYAMGRGTSRIPALDWLTCKTMGGIGTIPTIMIKDIEGVRSFSRSYLTKLIEILALVYKNQTVDQRPITWSTPYMDTQNLGAVISISMPILDYRYFIKQKPIKSNKTIPIEPKPSAQFRGIAGLDFTLESIRENLEIFNSNDVVENLNNVNAKYYAFIVDNNGIVYYHPRLKLPKKDIYMVRRTTCYKIGKQHRNSNTKVQYELANEKIRKIMGFSDSINTMDILEVEFRPSAAFRQFREMIINGTCKNENGFYMDDEVHDRIYRCFPIKNTPLTIGFVYNRNWHNLMPENLLEKFQNNLEYNNNNNNNNKGNSHRHRLRNGEILSNDPLGYWFSKMNFELMCDKKDEMKLNEIEPIHQFKTLLHLMSKGRCMKQKDSKNIFALLRATNSLLSKWRSIWPPSRPIQFQLKNFSTTTTPIETTIITKNKNSTIKSIKESHEILACEDAQREFPLPTMFEPRYYHSTIVHMVPSSLSIFFPQCQSFNAINLIKSSLFTADYSKLDQTKLQINIISNPLGPINSNDATTHTINQINQQKIIVMDEIRLNANEYTSKNLNPIIAKIAVEFSSTFFQDNFQKSLNSDENGWPECDMKNKRCLLVTTFGYVVASSGKNFKPMHLSLIEPQIFDHLVKHEIIQKTVWTDYQAECQMVPKTDENNPQNIRKQLELQRRLFGEEEEDEEEEEVDENINEKSENKISTTINSIPNKIANTAQTIRTHNFSFIWIQLFAIIETIFGFIITTTNSLKNTKNYVEYLIATTQYDTTIAPNIMDLCQMASSNNSNLQNFSPEIPKERCVLEHNEYIIHSRTTLELINITYRIGCVGNLKIISSKSVQLHLFILDKKCDTFPTISTNHRLMPHRVPECSLTNTRSRRFRNDLDYSRSHPEESKWECSFQSVASKASKASIPLTYVTIWLNIAISIAIYNV